MMFYLYLFLIGISVGSFINVVIDRLPFGKPLTGRSVCDYCNRRLSWKEIIPIVSFIFLKGKSFCCRKSISFYYPLVELISGLVLPFIFYFYQGELIWRNLILSLIVYTLIAIFFTDVKYMIIPDELQVILLIFSFFYILNLSFSGNFLVYGVRLFFLSIFKGLIVALPIASIFYITKGKGIGFADVKLAFNIGFLFGVKRGFLSLYIAFLLGGIVAFVLLFAKKKKLKSKIPFGPFLVISILLFLFFPKQILFLIRKII